MGGITPRRLNQIASTRAQELVISHEQAIQTIAYEHGLRLGKYLNDDEQAELRPVIAHLKQTTLTPANGPTVPKRRETNRKPVLVKFGDLDVPLVPGMTAAHANEAKMMAARVYPKLYVFENSARDLITRVLKDAIGDDWWDEVVLPKVRNKAQGRKDDEAKDPWHGKRGAALIDYLDLSDLPLIVTAPKAWPHFKKFFDRPSWFQELVNELNVSRRVAAHMNPLEDDDVKNVEAAFRKWAKLLAAKADLIP
jgi:Swt1-like HEPN